MTISEAIKFIVDQKDDKLLTDSQRFNAYLKDLCSDNPKELKIINRALDDNILQTIFSNEKDNVKIANLRDEFENRGMSETWSEFIISSFAQVLGWKYEAKKIENINNQEETKENKNTEEDWRKTTSELVNSLREYRELQREFEREEKMSFEENFSQFRDGVSDATKELCEGLGKAFRGLFS